MSASDTSPEKASLGLKGDLVQMSAQEQFIRKNLPHIGARITSENIYRTVHGTPEQIIAILRAIWSHKVEGWFHFDEELIESKICTREEYHEALVAECD